MGGRPAEPFGDLAIRSLTGFIAGAAAVALILAGGFWSTLLFAALGAVMAYEWRLLSIQGGDASVAGFQVLAVVGAAVMAYFGDLNVAMAFLIGVAGVGAAVDSMVGRTPYWGLVGALYIGLAVLLAVHLRGDGIEGLLAIIWTGAVVIATDIGGYFVGRLVGGKKLAPRISPGKTWAGLWGGMLFAAIASGAFSVLVLGYLELFLPILGAMLAGVAQTGDLVESAYKRRFDAKDSGAFLPGHGGALDRLDGMILAIIAVACLTAARGGAPIYQW